MRFTTVEEFEKWQAYFVRRKNEVEKQDYYLAAIPHAIYRSMTSAKTKLEDHLLKFEQPRKRQLSDAEMKTALLAAFGVTEE
jgi:hypothetical protein